MINAKQLIKSAVVSLLTVVLLADSGLFVYVTIKKQPSKLSVWLLRNRQDAHGSEPPNGYSATGIMQARGSTSRSGWVVRYSSPKCEHSRADEKRWSELKVALIKLGYQIYEVPPSLAEAYATTAPELAGGPQIVFVDVNWISKYRLMSTPTTLVFDRRGALVWSKVGEMNSEDQTTALKVAS